MGVILLPAGPHTVSRSNGSLEDSADCMFTAARAVVRVL